MRTVFAWFVTATMLAALGCGGSKGQIGADLILQVTPSSVTFGTTPINTVDTRQIELRHVGTSGDLELRGFTFSAGTSPELTLTPPDKTVLAPGEAVIVVVTYAPQDSVADAGELIVAHNVATSNFETRIPISALAQLAEVTASPDPIDFGSVKAGEFKDLNVMIKNSGADVMTVRRVFIKADESPDFSVQSLALATGLDLPLDLQPGDELGMTLRYTPTGGGSDTGHVDIEYLSKNVNAFAEFTLLGLELGPRIVLAPGVVDFGWVSLDDTKTLTFTVTNDGNDDLVIPAGGIVLTAESDDQLTLDPDAAEALTLTPGQNKAFDVTWKPEEPQAVTGAPIGAISVTSNDVNSNPLLLQVYGRVDAPYLTVFPETVNFGYVGQTVMVTRTVTLRNDGHGNLNVTDLTIEGDAAGEFAIVEDPEFAPTTAAGGSGVVDPSQAQMVTLTFTNNGAATGTVAATLHVKSNSPDRPDIAVPLSAGRAGTPECKVTFVPTSVNYGIVPIGFTKDLTMNLVNTGSGYCTYVDASIVDCTAFPLATCPEPFKGTFSKYFFLMNPPPKTPNGIGPGDTVPFQIRFMALAGSMLFGSITQYPGLLAVKVKDSFSNADVMTPPPPEPSDMGFPASYKANLNAASGIAKVSVMPSELDFGLVTIGCYSQTHKVCVYNNGSAPLTVSSISLAGCSPEFRTKNIPALPKNVSIGAPMCFDVVYVPQDLGADACTIQIESTDQTSSLLTLNASGEGTFETEQTDEFIQVSGQQVDVLFIIDDSGSMCDSQDRMIEQYDLFIQHSEIWNNDYHIGAISVNVVDDEIMGKLNRGDGDLPRYVTPTTTNGQTVMKQILDMGCEGNSDAQESGLQAAQVALSAPLVTDTGVACTTDSNCRNNTTICASPDTCPYYCIAGKCGGWNAGFIRKDAQLELIVLADEEDQSPNAVSFYTDFFRNIKGYMNVNMMHFNAIVGVDEMCSEGDPGERYMKVATDTNGKIGSICDDNYSTVMNQIGAAAFGLKVQFFLSRLADPQSVEVSVNGASCGAGWEYDANSNSVIFDEDGPCMPQPGDVIRIHYTTLCLAS